MWPSGAGLYRRRRSGMAADFKGPALVVGTIEAVGGSIRLE
jgi:hypothetical protein